MSKLLAITMAAAMAAGVDPSEFYQFRKRKDPRDRELTEADLAAIRAAEEKRERKRLARAVGDE